MKLKTLAVALASALPLLTSPHALAASTDEEIARLKQQIQALQDKVAGMGNTPAPAGNADVLADIQQQLAALSMKVESMTDAADNSPLSGLSITGTIDTVYSSDRNAHTSGFRFADVPRQYTYATSNLGDVRISIKKTFGQGPLAPYAQITLMPHRGSGRTSSYNGDYDPNNSIVNDAELVWPVSDKFILQAGQMPAVAGYEYSDAARTNTITHGLLYDFSSPALFTGVGGIHPNDAWTWQWVVGNETGRSSAPKAGGGINNTPSFAWRGDYQYNPTTDIGWFGYVGKLSTPNYQGTSPQYGKVFYTDIDFSRTELDTTTNAQFDYGRHTGGAWNGGTASWWGVSVARHQKFRSDTFGPMGWTLRYDYLNNQKNGGGTPNLYFPTGTDSANGFGVDPTCLAGADPMACKGSNRASLTAALLFYPLDPLQIKLEYRHDWASQPVFTRHDGSPTRHNDLISAQAVYHF